MPGAMGGIPGGGTLKFGGGTLKFGGGTPSGGAPGGGAVKPGGGTARLGGGPGGLPGTGSVGSTKSKLDKAETGTVMISKGSGKRGMKRGFVCSTEARRGECSLRKEKGLPKKIVQIFNELDLILNRSTYVK